MTWELYLRRLWLTQNSTIGILGTPDDWQCYVLEDVVRIGPKVYGRTAIPAGRYEIVITYSNRFKRPLPLLLRVPGFEGIRIHPGNTAADTEGCLLPGTTMSEDAVSQSRLAFGQILSRLKKWMKSGKCFITITDEFTSRPEEPVTA